MDNKILVRINKHIRIKVVDSVDIENNIAYYLNNDKSEATLFDKPTGTYVCTIKSTSKSKIKQAYTKYKDRINKARSTPQYEKKKYLFEALTNGIE